MTAQEERETDQSIELAHELLLAWMREEVRKMAFEIEWKPDIGDFRTGWESACEEMDARLRTAGFEAFSANWPKVVAP